MSDTVANPFFDPAIASRLSSQMLSTRFAMEGSIAGHHKSPHRGSSVEFAEYRNYVPGDDLRRLDWRVYAKTDRFYIKEFEAETNLRCHLVLDCSGSMDFSGDGERKLDYAQRLISTLAYMVIRQGDAAGLNCASEDHPTDVPSKRTPSHLQTIFRTQLESKAAGQTTLVETLHRLAENIRKRAVVMIFSDFFCDEAELLSALQHLRFQHHDVVVFQLLDPMEIEFKFERPMRFNDLESSSHLITEPSLVREEYLKQINAHLDRISRGCREFNIDYHRVLTTVSYEKILADFLVERAGRAAR